MIEQENDEEPLAAIDARLTELQAMADVREGAAQKALRKAAGLDRESFQNVRDLQEHSRLLERVVTDSEWLDVLSTYIPSREGFLKVWDEKNKLTRERIEQEQKTLEDHP
jgi:hypothetical protein